jgi:acyl carrier protein
MSDEVFNKVVDILKPYARNKEALDAVTAETNILKDLKVNSSRLVDIVLAFEDEFDIEVEDGEADQVRTIGAAVDLIKTKT